MRPQGSGATHRLSVCEAHPKSTPAPTLAPPHHDTRPCGSAIARGRARLCTEIPRETLTRMSGKGAFRRFVSSSSPEATGEITLLITLL
jgi:hypothetical protein